MQRGIFFSISICLDKNFPPSKQERHYQLSFISWWKFNGGRCSLKVPQRWPGWRNRCQRLNKQTTSFTRGWCKNHQLWRCPWQPNSNINNNNNNNKRKWCWINNSIRNRDQALASVIVSVVNLPGRLGEGRFCSVCEAAARCTPHRKLLFTPMGKKVSNQFFHFHWRESIRLSPIQFQRNECVSEGSFKRSFSSHWFFLAAMRGWGVFLNLLHPLESSYSIINYDSQPMHQRRRVESASLENSLGNFSTRENWVNF